MKYLRSFLISVLMLSAALVNGAEPNRDITGDWQGVLNAGQVKLRLVFHISPATGGGFTATLDSLDQGARGIPVNRVVLEGQSLSLEVNTVHGLYKGTWDSAANTIAGQWSQGPNTLALNLARGSGTEAVAESRSEAELAASREAAKKILGTWNGVLATGSGNLHLRINLRQAADATTTGTMDSLDQGANGLPLSAVTLQENKVRFEVRGVGGTYTGTLAADGATVSGEWTQNGNTLPLDFKKTKAE